MAIAYSEITLLNLTEFVTYIYYAEDNVGTGASRTPTEASKYIGIYNGPQLTIIPNEPTLDMINSEYWSGWSKYVGEDGEDGSGGLKFTIETNQNEILKFYRDREIKTFSPPELEIWIASLDGKVKFPVSFNSPEEDEPIQKFQLSIFSASGNFSFELKDPGEEEVVCWEKSLDENLQETETFEEKTVKINRDYFYLNPERETLTINLQDFIAFGKKYSGLIFHNPDEESNEEPYQYNAIEREIETALSINSQEGILKLEAKVENYDIFAYCQIRYGMNEDMATFALEANGIYQAIQSTSLAFTADGLTVRNGGIEVYNRDDKRVFSFNDDTGDLEIEGIITAIGGEFSGVLKSATGEFSGTIVANQGEIGGFEITDNCLSAGADLKLYSDYKIDGESQGSLLQVKNIEIGTGAKISEFLQLGNNVKLLNPESTSSGSFLLVSDESNLAINMTQNGIIELGNGAIKLDGKARKIYGGQWTLSPDLAEFKNVIINGSLKAVSFEHGEVSSVGGVIFVRPSSRIVSISEYKEGLKEVKIESAEGFDAKDICSVQNQFYTINEVLENNTLIISGNLGIENIGRPLVNLGANKSVGIGINGSKDTLFGLTPNAITVNEFNTSNNFLEPKIILGQLPDQYSGNSKMSYGLYADNVILNGQLTTRNEIVVADDTQTYSEDGEENLNKTIRVRYSGIGTNFYEGAPNTKNMGARFPQAGDNGELGQILFWAGAEGVESEQIEASKFFVDEYGNMYAGSGYFDGTIITNSTIRAAEIQTAIIKGTGLDNSKEVGLTIADVTDGIDFVKKVELEGAGDGKEAWESVYKLSLKDGIKTQLIFDSSNEIKTSSISGISSPKFYTTNNNGKILAITENQLQYNNTSFILANNGLELNPSGIDKLKVKTDAIMIWGDVQYKHNNDVKYEYKQILQEDKVVGYDIYVY